ncbi:hypothetical protein AAFF_G00065570 [Aldrovandia affinis]|uniref:Uncharacterized protein n=1 Tax=Aldrovandia affinis TaxID=143900 RepID=A0AAD7T3V4_9TELE|nr:hypothetical protein AAFF_G00065570 [Aldrovandia affinis]
MFGRQPDHLLSTVHCSLDRHQPVTMRSALLNRNSPRRRRRRHQQVRFDLEDEQGVTPEGRTRAERCRLGAGPGSPHPNRRSLVGKELTANGGSVGGGVVRGDMVAPTDPVGAALRRAPPHPLTPAPSRRALAPPQAPPTSITPPLLCPPCLSAAIQMYSLQKPLPLYVTRARSHSLEDIIGMEGATAQLCGHASNSRLPGEGLSLQDLALPPPPRIHPSSCPPIPKPRPAPTLHPTLRKTTDAPLTPDQAQTLKQVQNLLGGLVLGARGAGTDLASTRQLASTKEQLLGPLREARDLRTRLQSLEGLLETSHSTIRLLLDLIQDLERNEAGSEQRPRYTTAQSLEGRGTSTDCIIYSVENDFVLQEGKFTQSWMTADPQMSDQSPSQATSSPKLRRKEPCQAALPPHTGKKGRRKCFWFL